MNNKVKLIIEIPKPMYESVQNGTYCGNLYEELKNGIPLDKIRKEVMEYIDDLDIAYEICGVFDNIGKAEKGGE